MISTEFRIVSHCGPNFKPRLLGVEDLAQPFLGVFKDHESIRAANFNNATGL